MTESSPEADCGALETRWLPLVRLGEEAKQSAVAIAIGIDPADLSRFKKGQFKLNVVQFYALLKAVKAKVVDESSRCLSEEKYRLITQCPELAQKIMREQPQLIWDDK
jgi:hypothetical protein